MTEAYPLQFEAKAIEGNSALIELVITDVDGVTPIVGASVTTAEMTLRNKEDGVFINGHGDPTPTDVKSNIGSDGKFSYILDPDDNPILTTSALAQQEIHILNLKIVADNGLGEFTLDREIWITVRNERLKPEIEEEP